MRLRALFAIATAILAASCTGKPEVACNAALARPALLVDLHAFVAAHPAVSGRLCPSRTGARAGSPRCIAFALDADGTLAATSRFGAQGASAGVLRIYLTPSDDRLTVRLRARGLRAVSETVGLRGHRGPGRCSNFVYSTVVVAATGTLTTS